jgi:hypothetical protein
MTRKRKHAQDLHDEHSEERHGGRLFKYFGIIRSSCAFSRGKLVMLSLVRYVGFVAFHGSHSFLLEREDVNGLNRKGFAYMVQIVGGLPRIIREKNELICNHEIRPRLS